MIGAECKASCAKSLLHYRFVTKLGTSASLRCTLRAVTSIKSNDRRAGSNSAFGNQIRSAADASRHRRHDSSCFFSVPAAPKPTKRLAAERWWRSLPGTGKHRRARSCENPTASHSEFPPFERHGASRIRSDPDSVPRLISGLARRSPLA